jgi:hypothetical protein
MNDMEAVNLHAFSSRQTHDEAILAKGRMARFRRHNPNMMNLYRAAISTHLAGIGITHVSQNTATGSFARQRYPACLTPLPYNILSSGNKAQGLEIMFSHEPSMVRRNNRDGNCQWSKNHAASLSARCRPFPFLVSLFLLPVVSVQ